MERLSIAIATAIALAAPSVRAMEPAPLVLPPVGTKIHYDEGGTPTVWTVVESKPGAYAARRDDGLTGFASAGGIVTPAHSFRDVRGFDGTQKLITGDPLAIYPIAVGKNTKFTVGGAAPARGTTWTHDHACAVTGTEKVKVAIGEFDTFVVHCERRAARGKEQTVTRYYAPAIGMTVRSITVDHINNNRWSTDVVKLEKP